MGGRAGVLGRVIRRAESGAFGRTLLSASSAATAIQSLLGGTVLEKLSVRYSNAALWTNSTTTPSTILTLPAGLFDPDSVYVVDVFGMYYAAATTTGIAVNLDPGNLQYGATLQEVRGASQAAMVYYSGSIAAGTYAIGLSSPTSPGRAHVAGRYMFRTALASPTALNLVGASEVAGSAVTIAAGELVATVSKVVP